jgi:hypothetical protein
LPNDCTIERKITIGHSLETKSSRSLACAPGQFLSLDLIANQLLERGRERGRIIWINKESGLVPDFAQTRDIAQNEGAAGEGGFEHGKPERLLTRGQTKNRGARKPGGIFLAP